MKLLSIGGSNSKNSINRKFAKYASGFFESTENNSINVSEINLPIYSLDEEAANGIHPIAKSFAQSIDSCDLIIISLAENNGSYNVGFKNLVDWTSRIKERKTWGNKAMLLLSTAPGARGGLTVLEAAKNYYPRMGANIVGSFSLPKFQENFSEANGIINEELKKDFLHVIEKVKLALASTS
ncbi:MAG: NAD(P)H-dependent oxidoreductase [Sphingobacteriaceae bacterium]|nr:NAD(P)H-dependent oxidoreductase [Sphingobacteriaceae bacterium]